MAKSKGETAPRRKDFRVGNFKVSAYEHKGVPVFEVANLEDTWMVRVPVDFQMYGILNQLFADLRSKDEVLKKNAGEVLSLYFMNWQNVTGIPSGHYHQGLVLLTAAYMQPDLLKSSFWGKGKRFYKDVKTLRLSFLEWYKGVERMEKETDAEVDPDKDYYAEQSVDILKSEATDGKE